ncbi:ABC-three component system middle component 2 [Paludisphaera soli]|uniref:ABC-three component system middle component 2 n=1 Tax=Paludisphaera soli TaxID=2712865 RepID=UPI0013ED50D2|nr:ABC-three component system middle component 2 [Paludisphaera soli]
MAERPDRPPNPFNSPVETGLRAIVLLAADYPAKCDLRRLVVYDYLLVHSDDAPGGPLSLHPRTPHRSGELLVRRKLIQEGLMLMISRELATVEYSDRGVCFSATELTRGFLEYLSSDYARDLQERARWVVATFAEYTDELLTQFALSHLQEWGGEFLNESSLRLPKG